MQHGLVSPLPMTTVKALKETDDRKRKKTTKEVDEPLPGKYEILPIPKTTMEEHKLAQVRVKKNGNNPNC
jgi:hypothetical protein